jgi:alcohol dehydrogenase class IV
LDKTLDFIQKHQFETDIYIKNIGFDKITLENHTPLFIVSNTVQNKMGSIHKYIKSTFRCEPANYFMHIRGGGEPSTAEIDSINNATPDKIDMVIGIGGGSIMDISKFIALLKISGGKCYEYEFGEREIIASLPTIMIPTTSGSGSEVTNYSVVTNSVSNRKFTIAHQALYPRMAIIDPTLSLGMNKNITISTAIDAFLHCMESILRPLANKMLLPIAYKGMRIVLEHLPIVLSDPKNIESRTELSYAGVLGGLCISKSRTGLVHTLSVAFSKYSSCNHGILNGRMLPYTLDFNADAYRGDFLNIANNIANNKFQDEYEAIVFIKRFVSVQLNKLTIDNLGIRMQDKPDIVARVLQDAGLSEVNHKKVTYEQISNLVGRIIKDAD